MFERILIANRGEIACRIIRTCQRLGIKTIAIYSEADERALHVFLADQAYLIGPSSAKESYLNIERILSLAKDVGADAIHPGYGFLSENAEFSKACLEANIAFIGAPHHAIAIMGQKSESKALMAEHGVPIVPGYHGADQSLATFREAADKAGYPVLIKASFGGGGKGMRLVRKPADLAEAIESAKREARASFGDETLLLEKYLENPRHIEIQVFGDKDGNYVHLFERDCSLQRRHQKIIEEAPAPGVDQTFRNALGQAAIQCARAVEYHGAGTVEFIVDEERNFYFMEMNTRLQVEHPVTEMITGQDLVEWQILVAQNQALPLEQEALDIYGHAFEARIYAEDPARDFLPATGKVLALKQPAATERVRIDGGIRQGDEITVHYDPMLAKLVVWGKHRQAALQALRTALDQYQLIGLPTNRDFLRKITRHPDFVLGFVDTHFIQNHAEDLKNFAKAPSTYIFACVALYRALKQLKTQGNGSPWSQLPGWRLNAPAIELFEFFDHDQTIEVRVRLGEKPWCVCVGEEKFEGHGSIAQAGHFVATLNHRRAVLDIYQENGSFFVQHEGDIFTIEAPQWENGHVMQHEQVSDLSAPMPGTIIQCFVEPGSVVEKGDRLLILEAMKMEHTLSAPYSGVVSAVHFEVGDLVEQGVPLLIIDQE